MWTKPMSRERETTVCKVIFFHSITSTGNQPSMKARRRTTERKQLCYCWSSHKPERIHSTPSTSCSTSAPPAVGTLWPSAHSSRARRPSALAAWSGAGWGPLGPVRPTPPHTSPPAETAVHHTEWTEPARIEEGGSGRGYLGEILEHTRHVLITHRLLVADVGLQVRFERFLFQTCN